MTDQAPASLGLDYTVSRLAADNCGEKAVYAIHVPAFTASETVDRIMAAWIKAWKRVGIFPAPSVIFASDDQPLRMMENPRASAVIELVALATVALTADEAAIQKMRRNQEDVPADAIEYVARLRACIETLTTH